MLEETEKQGRSTEKGEGKKKTKKKTAAAVSNDLRPLQNRSSWEREGGECAFVRTSVCLPMCVCLWVSAHMCV